MRRRGRLGYELEDIYQQQVSAFFEIRWLTYFAKQNFTAFYEANREEHRDYDARAPRACDEKPPPCNTPSDVSDFFVRQEYTYSRLGYYLYDLDDYFPGDDCANEFFMNGLVRWIRDHLLRPAFNLFRCPWDELKLQ
eukprot:285839-Prorocentrum_lima.AAC.1